MKFQMSKRDGWDGNFAFKKISVLNSYQKNNAPIYDTRNCQKAKKKLLSALDVPFLWKLICETHDVWKLFYFFFVSEKSKLGCV